jgi:hypothetical protein
MAGIEYQKQVIGVLHKALTQVYYLGTVPMSNNQLEDESLATSLRESLEDLAGHNDYPIIGKSKMAQEVPPVKAINGIGDLSLKNLQSKMT